MRFWAAGLALILAGNAWVSRRFSPPFPDPTTLSLTPESAVRTGVLVSMGMRRLAADLELIQLLIYYGTSENGVEEEPEAFTFGKGNYPEIKSRVLRIIALDPSFRYAALYGAGALAFNLDRQVEALDILRVAAERDPKEWKYRMYAGAIAAQKKGDPGLIVRELTPVLSDPDCPTMLKHMLAFLNRRLGRREEAVRIYRDILRSRDPSYYPSARRALTELGAFPGE